MSDINIVTVDSDSVCGACSQILGRRPAAPTPDAISAVAGALEWKTCIDWEHQSDSEIWVRTELPGIPFTGSVFIVTEASLTKCRGSAFVVDARALAEFIRQHLSRFGECFFNGDVVIVERDGRYIWLFHHEGMYTLISSQVTESSNIER